MGDDACVIIGNIDAHVAEEQVHGLMLAPLSQDQQHHAQFGHHVEHVDEEEEGEGGHNGLRADL